MKHLTLNRVFAVYVLFFVALIAGIVPRESVVYVTALLALWMLAVPLEEAALFFVRSVPLFVAIPLTATYDNLNMWRPLAVLLLLRLLLQRETLNELKTQWHAMTSSFSVWLKTHPVTRRLSILGVFATLSLIGAAHPLTGLVRIIYFVNLLMVPVVIWTLVRRGTIGTKLLIHNILIPVILVIVAGYIQLISTYLMDVYAFMRIWGEGIQLRQFGTNWSYIAVYQGNTWLAYYGPQLSLRVFSLFTDSHTFPMFILFGLPALFTISLVPVVAVAERGIVAMTRTRARMMVLWIPAALLIAILSGTRGIWAAGIATGVLAFFFWLVMSRIGITGTRRSVFGYVSLYFVMFAMLFFVAWPIFTSPQFLIGKGDFDILGNRLHSIIDFGETSNALRLKIWGASIRSIGQHPLLGVGIGNFPVVLGQNIALAKAGSTAHNVYLHVAAEMGVFAGLEFIVLLWSVVAAAWKWFRSANGPAMVYAATSLLMLVWVYGYLLTDAALFDERAFLMFGITAALLFAQRADTPARA